AADNEIAQQAVTGLRPRGELLLSGIGPTPLSLDVGPLVLRALTVRGHVTGGPIDIQDAMDFAVANGIRPWIESVPLDDAGSAVTRMQQGQARFRMVLQP